MKDVYFVRHAKSSWEDLRLDDHDRPLNPRGHRDAPIMAKYLNQLGKKPDGILTSTALRASTTADYFANEWQIPGENIIRLSNLYHSYPQTMYERIAESSDEWNAVALFAHNPGMTMMANQFSPDDIDNIPTCAVFQIRFPIESWMELMSDHSRGQWMNLWTPKTIF